MRHFVLVGVALIFSASLVAQRPGAIYGGGVGYRTYGSPSGFGNVLFPGTGTPPPVRSHPQSISDLTFASRLAATVSGFPGYTGAPTGARHGRRGAGVVSYAVPVYVGGYGYGYGYGYPQEPQVAAEPQQPQQPQAPQVIINQYYGSDTAKPVVREYSSGSSDSSGIRVYAAPSKPVPDVASDARPERAEDKATIYLLAFKDNSIQSALAYWVEDETLHYVTAQGSHNKASLDLVDREFSERLNRERGLDFRLSKN